MGKTQNNRSTLEKDSYQLTPSQVMSLITSTIIGVGVLTLPRSVTESAHQSGWISVILGGMVGFVAIWMTFRIGRRFPGKNLISLSHTILGTKKHPWVGRIFTFPMLLVFILFWLVTTAGVARTFGEVVVTAVLLRTPLEVTVGTMLFVAFLLVMYDLEVMARVNEILLPIIILPVAFIAIVSFQSADFMRLMPIISVDWKSIIKGSLSGAFTYQGYELLALYLGNMEINKGTKRAALLGIAVPMLIYILIVVAGIAAFGFEELRQLTWPTLELVKTTEVPGLILERLESAFLGVWVAAVFTTTANMYFSACFALKKLLNLKTHRYPGIVCLPLLYYLAMWPKNVHQLFDYLHWISLVGIIISFFSPLILLFIAWVRKQGKSFAKGDNGS